MFLFWFFFNIVFLVLYAKQQQKKFIILFTLSICYAWMLHSTALEENKNLLEKAIFDLFFSNTLDKKTKKTLQKNIKTQNP
jgi:uncharacterized membrane-anchored protein YitT (DUF2179 family)